MAVVVISVPEDMVEDILSRLPVKSVERFRCLSKSSDSLISTRSFAMMHMKQGIRVRQKIFVSSYSHLMSFEYAKENASADIEGALSMLDFPPKTLGSNISLRIVGSCHGLLCMSLQRNKDFYLWNPSTRQYNKLPDPPAAAPGYKPSVYGLGYDSFSDDYKLVYAVTRRWSGHSTAVFQPNQDDDYKVYILCLRENCWRNIQLVPSCSSTISSRASFLNGTLNWVVEGKDSNTLWLLAFDLKTESFFELPTPDFRPHNRSDTKYFASMGVLQGRLCLLVSMYVRPNYVHELWMMNEYGVGQSWIRLMPDVSCREICWNWNWNWDWHTRSAPLCISNDNQIILLSDLTGSTRLDAQERKLVKCRLLCKCDDHNYSSYRCRPRDGFVYLETLVSPYVNNK